MQLAVPQPYPEGQQPGLSPSSPSQRYQPEAQVAVVEAGTAAAGTTTVTPLPSTMVVGRAGGGHEVVLQSRPVWQQPPPAEARQA